MGTEVNVNSGSGSGVKFIIILLLALAGLSYYSFTLFKADKEKSETISSLRGNVTSLYDSAKTFKTKDGLNAITVKQLNFTIDQYKKYRSEDAGVIKSLKVDLGRLQNVYTAQTTMIRNVKVQVKDSIIYRDKLIPDTIKCAQYKDKWLDFIGCFSSDGTFSGTIESRDDLIYEEHIIPKRFLGFLWKYGCKERRRNIVSKNPYSKIINAEYIVIQE